MAKKYSLMSTEPLTDFDNEMLQALQYLADTEFKPRTAVLAALDEEGNVGTYYVNAQLSDMILMHGFIGLDIQADYIETNFPELTGDDDEEGG